MQKWGEPILCPTAGSLPIRPLILALASLFLQGGLGWPGLGGWMQEWMQETAGASPEGPFCQFPRDLTGKLCS